MYLRTDRAGYEGVSRSVKHLAARPPGWYRFRDGGVATIIRPRFFTTCFVRRSNVAQAPTYITVVEGLGLSPYDLLVGAHILKQLYTSCFGLHKSFCTVQYRVPGTVLTGNVKYSPSFYPVMTAVMTAIVVKVLTF